MKVALANSIQKLSDSGKEFISLFTHGTLQVELYKPHQVDRQKPHIKDEVYVIVSGSGKFINNNVVEDVKIGDLLFVAAGNEHRFFEFTNDFSTWVIFYGPEGGEK